MKAESKLFTDSQGNTLEYCLYGEGEKYLICYPGFGETYESFEKLSSRLNNYTLLAINLYFIGSSQRSKRGFLRNEEWQSTLGQLLDHLGIERFSVLGFSLGGRFALSTFEVFYERMDHILFAAPDGVSKRFTYELATFPVFFRQLFWVMMKYPRPYFVMVDLLAKMKLINTYLANFSKSQMGDEHTRMTIYRSWITFKYLRVSQKRLLRLIEMGTTQTLFIFGEKDKIISPVRHLSFINKLQNRDVLILPFGHNRLVDNAIEDIKKVLD